jgi:hypothetical protein
MFIDKFTERIGMQELKVARWGGGAGSVDYSTKETEADQKKFKKVRSALFQTEGGSQGQELQLGETKKRETLFGN